ncbi:hypothetical protein F01_140111 [Burkholderia cenocepacia]|nr:hypothetical protein F01_140111 [Burkholderia cenocepacia]
MREAYRRRPSRVPARAKLARTGICGDQEIIRADASGRTVGRQAKKSATETVALKKF